MQEKTQIDEKRVRSTVIRRRKTVVETPEPEETSGAAEVLAGMGEGVREAKAHSEKAPSAAPSAAEIKKEGSPAKDAAVAAVPAPAEEEEEEGAKKPRVKKAVKKKGTRMEVEVEGIGKVASLTQLTRLVHADRVERVFEPTRIGKKKRVIAKKGLKKTAITVSKPIKRIVEMQKAISVGDLAKAVGVKSSEIIKKLMALSQMATINQVLDVETATLVAHEFQFEVKDVSFSEEKILAGLQTGLSERLEGRAPVVTVMGHVDHGKTSLLDAIRQTNVTATESGGITQHIGAYTVAFPKGKVTFLDTPGHEAFTAMRARGASVTDLVVLVVAADDGVMPQTVESIHHAKAAGVPIVVAVNKIDKPDANIERIKRQLGDQGLVPEEWGGDTLYSLVSAKQKKGIEELLENILLQAEVLQLKADPYVLARGVVVEARLDRYRGPVATVLVRQGTLRVGDVLVAGCYSGKVRAMMDHTGRPTNEAPPSYAVEILGLNGVPFASDPFHGVTDEQTAVEIAEHRQEEKKKAGLAATSKVSLEDFFQKVKSGQPPELKVIVKADVHGSLEAVQEALSKVGTEKARVKVIHGAVGGITESDVLLASASEAVVIGFTVRPDTNALAVARVEGVDVKLYKIIYEMMEDIKLALRGLLAPTKKEKYLGRAEVRQTFTVSKVGTVAGSFVIDGKVTRTANLRLLRDNVVVCEGKVSSLKRFKDDVKEVLQGFECGIGVEGYQDIKAGDVIEAFDIELIKAEL